VFDPGLGLLRAGFLVSRYGFDFCATRKNKQREKNPAPGAGTYSRWKPRVKANGRENAPKSKDLADFGRQIPSS
jgi:predicted alpha/beta-hydrolase family hydrolase